MLRSFRKTLAAVGMTAVGALSGCVTTEGSKTPSDPSATALEPSIDSKDVSDDSPSTSHSQVGPYELIAPDSVELLDNGSIRIQFSAPCTSLGSDRVLVLPDSDSERKAHVGVLFAKSECRKGSSQEFERVISPGMTEFGAGLPDRAKVSPLRVSEYRLVPATSVVIDDKQGATMTFSAPCEKIARKHVVSSLEPRSKVLSVAVVYLNSGCQAGPGKVFSDRFDLDSDEYLTLGGGEKDLIPRPMWVQ